MNLASETTTRKDLFWYEHPAEQWDEALPLANGRIGAMVYGGVRAERFYLSETTFWSGESSLENNNPAGPAVFQTVRQHLLSRDIEAANEVAHQLEGRKLNYGTNLPFGNVRLLFDHEEMVAYNYRRELNLDDAVVRVCYTYKQVDYQREVFVSASHQVLAIRLTCSRPGGLTFRVALDGDEQPYRLRTEGTNTLLMDNRASETLHSDGRVGTTGHARLYVQVEVGQIGAVANQLSITRANAVTILLAIGTSYNGNDPVSQCQQQIAAASAIAYEALRADHTAEHSAWFRRVSLDLGSNPHPDWSIDRRVKAARKGEYDPNLCALLFQFGRYLLIGSSRPNSPLPAHLTGAWNDNVACRIEWTCDYHLDINTQMNYWIAESTNLSELHEPLFRWIEQTLVPSGRQTAKILYDLPGWVAHIFSNPWGFTAWGWSTAWGVHPTGGVWIASHLWDHYSFTGDRQFLAERAYPALREAAEFCLAYLIKDPQTGWLVSGPANSPENAFLYQGQSYAVDVSPTADRILLYGLFTSCIEASQILAVDEDFRKQLSDARDQLPPFQVGRYGQLQEWLDDYEEALPGHRHTAHLLGVFPFSQITPSETPELAQAARVSIERRQSAPDFEEGAWARNLITLYFARLQDREAAYESLTTLFRKAASSSLFIGTKIAQANAYELDYNTGASAAIAEMLLQSHSGVIVLLPALPDAWAAGEVRGLCARGGFEVAIRWNDHELVESRIKSTVGGLCRVNVNAQSVVMCDGAPIAIAASDARGVAFDTLSGKEYIISSPKGNSL
jgi:alpha-L-fucosidase 2